MIRRGREERAREIERRARGTRRKRGRPRRPRPGRRGGGVGQGGLEDADFVAAVPDLLFPEVGQAPARLVKRGRISLERFQVAAGLRLRACTNVWPTGLSFVVGAAAGCRRRQLSVYDACYAVLAEVEQAVLVTADQGPVIAVTRPSWCDREGGEHRAARRLELLRPDPDTFASCQSLADAKRDLLEWESWKTTKACTSSFFACSSLHALVP